MTMRDVSAIIGAVLVLAGSAAADAALAADFHVVDNGKARTVVVTADKPSRMAAFAAEELSAPWY